MSRKRGNSSPTPPPRSPSPSPSPASLTHSRKRAKPTAPTPSRKRAKLPPSDFEIIRNLLGSVSTIDFISDDSLYSFILHVTIRSPVCVSGVEVSSFCMKITFVNEGRPNEYEHTTTKGGDIYKKTIDKKAIDKEVDIQRELYDSFSSPFVPRVFAASIFLKDEFIQLFDSLLQLAVVFDKNARQHVSSIIKHVNEHPTWDVHIFLMEYMDKSYDTLYNRSFESIPDRSPFTPTKNQNEYQHMAANLVCVASVGFILYDAHNKNGLCDTRQQKVVLLDFGDAFDVRDQGDKEKLKNIFIKFVNEYKYSIPYLCKFFNVPYQHDQHDQSLLLKAFVDNLTFTDFRTKVPNITDIHHTLMMVAFVDFMIHFTIGVWLIRCRYVMESIYKRDGFVDFLTFLTTFTPVLSSRVYNTELTKVAGFITGITGNDNPVPRKQPKSCSIMGGKRKNKSKRKTKKYRRIL